MLKNYTRLFLILLTLSCAVSCTKKGNTGPAGPVGPAGPSATTGISQINGHVSLYDQYGTRQYTGLNNVKLVVNNGTYSYADVNGYYVFPGLTSKGCNVSASATGYGTTMFNVNLLSDTVYRDVKLSAVPNFQVVTFKAFHNVGSQYDSLVLSFNSDSRPRNCIVFVGSSADVSNQPANYVLAYTKTVPVLATRVNIQVPVTDLNGANFFFGQEVYFAAYSYVVNDASVYEDQITGRNVYNAVGTPVIDSTTAP